MPTAEAFLGVLPFNLKGASPIPRKRNPNQGSSLNDRFSRLFKHRGSKVVTAETDQQRTRADRTCISEFETQYLQQRSTELILQNDFLVVRTICQLDVSGDRAATMASHLVSFLRGNPQTSDHVIRFVMDAFDVHVKKYSAASPNPRNVLRDNNLATMLVVSYLQQSCRDYLVSILQPVMTAIAPFVENCELDPMRLPEGSGVGVTARNSYNLYCVCRSVLDAVFSAGKHAPAEMHMLCTLIRSRIESAWDIPMFPPATPSVTASTPVSATRRSVQKQKEPQQPMLELREWESNLKTTVQVDIMSDIKAALDEWLENPQTPAAVAAQAQAQAQAQARNSQRTSARSPLVPPSPKASANSRDSQVWELVQTYPKSTPPQSAATSDDSHTNKTRQSIVEMMSSSFSNLRDPDTTLSIGGGRSSQPPKARPPISPTAKESWRLTQNSRKHLSPAISTRMSKHASKRFSGSYFSPVETVISMLIFVRFFIPILTAPDAYGIDVKMSRANRRGLLLCAKVLAVLCNGVSFGAKETYLMSMNGLIREYRPKLRSYLHAISSRAKQPAAEEEDDEDVVSDGHVSDDEGNDGETVTIDELASQFKVVTVGAKIATKEEQRKSRMSFSRAAFLSGAAPMTPDTLEADLPPLPDPVPPIPPKFKQQQHQHQPHRKQSILPHIGKPMPSIPSSDSSPPKTRTTIDLPTRIPSNSVASSNSLSMMSAVAVSTSASDSLVDNEIIDESLVTIDFLISLEGNFPKFEAYVNDDTFGMSPEDQSSLQTACRELKPIVHYAKHLSTPGRMPETVSIANTHHMSDRLRRHAMPFETKKSEETSRISEEFEDLGRRRASTLPHNDKYY
ncbi:hypothetical protein GGI07_002088 [Coemansia sp. Benny D115]|nr:hypothetical protein GGI07_002088 [Coemansia sp. Benny D115]